MSMITGDTLPELRHCNLLKRSKDVYKDKKYTYFQSHELMYTEVLYLYYGSVLKDVLSADNVYKPICQTSIDVYQKCRSIWPCCFYVAYI